MVHRSGFVSLLGRPNSGKSTLLNTLVGQKVSIVSDKPQTTRNRISGVLDRDDVQIIFVDTPGIHRPLFEMNRRMMALTRDSARGVDLLVLLVDGNLPFGAGDMFVVELLRETAKPVILLINKIDLMDKRSLLPVMDRYSKLYPFEEIIPASALTGDNVDVLVSAVVARLEEGPKYFDKDVVVDQSERFVVAEMVREKLLRYTRDEIPYAAGVIVDSFEEVEDADRIDIQAVIYVEKESQKRIVIGKGGSLLKQVGTEARRDIERLLASHVFLGLRVKVRPDWRNNDGLLRVMGIRKKD